MFAIEIIMSVASPVIAFFAFRKAVRTENVGLLFVGIFFAFFSIFFWVYMISDWKVQHLLKDVRSGTSWSVGVLYPSTAEYIHGRVDSNVTLTVAKFPNIANDACARKLWMGNWWKGKQFTPDLNNGQPLNVEVIGRATRPDYRYLIKASGSGIDSDCVDTFLITAHDLSNFKEAWKTEMELVREHSTESVDDEVASVHRIP